MMSDLTTFKVDMTIAKWNGTAYDYSGDANYILSNDQLYGVHSPFTSVGGTNMVKMYAGGPPGSTINSYIIFHKVSTTGLILTGYALVRDHTYDQTVGANIFDITNPTYNKPIVDANIPTIFVFGFESFQYIVDSEFENFLFIFTGDGVTAKELRSLNSTNPRSVLRSYYGSYFVNTTTPPPPPETCLSGCICTDGSTCSSCLASHYRVPAPVNLSGSDACPCISGFYEDTDSTCKPCPKASNC